MNKKIMQMLINSKNEYISGQYISEQLGISRAAVSKRICKLKNSGIEIEGITKKGYKLIINPIIYPDTLNKELIEIGMQSKFIGQNVIVLDSIESTNDYSKKNSNSLIDGHIILSKEQTKGKGRRGRSFHSSKNDGLYFSIYLKPLIEPSKSPFITSIAGAAIIKALSDLNIKALVKWPNDIIINDKKIAGILTEMSADIEFIDYIVVGIGINVNTINFPDDLKLIASSIKIEGYNISKLDLLFKCIYHFEILYNEYINEKSDNVINILKENSSVLGKKINIQYHDKIIKAQAIDIDNNGSLIVKTEDNNIEVLNSGEISIRQEM